MIGMMKDSMGQWLRTALDLAYQRHAVLASNLANLDTPGYVAEDLDFRSFLQDHLDSGAPVSEGVLPEPGARPGALGMDGNRVDLETEMSQMAANQLFYQMGVQAAGKRLALMRYAIDEGGR